MWRRISPTTRAAHSGRTVSEFHRGSLFQRRTRIQNVAPEMQSAVYLTGTQRQGSPKNKQQLKQAAPDLAPMSRQAPSREPWPPT